MLRLHHGLQLSLICAAALTVAACTQAPVAPKAAVSMESATTAQDWDGVAKRITAELRQRGMLLAPQAGAAPSSPPWGPYFVHVTTPGSAFLQSVAETLKAEIIGNGGSVARAPDGAVVINLGVDFVRHGPREQMPAGAGSVAGAGYGISELAGSSATSSIGAWGAAGMAAGAGLVVGGLADAFFMNNPTMAAEVIWKASVSSPQQVLMQVGGPMYISSSDIALYMGDAKLAEMTTPGTTTRVQAQRLRYR